MPIVPAYEQGFKKVFTPQGSDLYATLPLYSNSGQFDQGDVSLQDIVDKSLESQINATEEALTGIDEHGSGNHYLLGNIKGAQQDKYAQVGYDNLPFSDENPKAEKLLAATQKILTRNNRFTPLGTKNFVSENDTSQMQWEDKGIATVQPKFGVYEMPTAEERFVFSKLRQIGSSLLLKAARFDTSTSVNTSKNPDTFTPDANNPITEGSDIRVSPLRLRAKDAKGAPQNVFGENLSDPNLVGPYGGKGRFLPKVYTHKNSSYGTTFIPGMEFDSTSASILIAQTTAAVIALQAAARQFESLITQSNPGTNTLNLARGPYLLGESPTSTSSAYTLFKQMVITQTKYPYSAAVRMGIKVFFGEKPGEAPDVKKSQHIEQAPGYWLAIARTMLRSVDDFTTTLDKASSYTVGDLARINNSLAKSRIIGFLNTAATVGDSFLQMTGGRGSLSSLASTGGPNDVDALPDTPATRVVKSRSGGGPTASALAWRGESMPSMFILPRPVISAVVRMGNIMNGQNPAKGMLGSRLIEKTYLDPSLINQNSRIPNDIVERFENAMDAEYVPFYFHDIRTNEITAFHAFLDSLDETYSANYQSMAGLGRVDPVYIYQNSTRTINLSFTIAATSKDDFNEMWFKINKLMTLVYPQWSAGQKVKALADGGVVNSFRMPFSQVMKASPLIRLRVGDVIKTNYSKFNLARIFGIGQRDTIVTDAGSTTSGLLDGDGFFGLDKAADAQDEWMDSIFYSVFGSPLGFGFAKGNTIAHRMLRSAASTLLTNGFVNPISKELVMLRLRDPDNLENTLPSSITLAGAIESAVAAYKGSTFASKAGGYYPGEIHYLRATEARRYVRNDKNGTEYRVLRPVKIVILKGSNHNQVDLKGASKSTIFNKPDRGTMGGPKNTSMKMQRGFYKVAVLDFNAPAFLFGKEFIVAHADIMPNPNSIFNPTIGLVLGAPGLLGFAAQALMQFAAVQIASMSGVPVDTFYTLIGSTSAAKFMGADVNPVVRAFDSTKGRGLAGFIKTMKFDWLEFPWEVDFNSRAPKGVKVVMTFDPIHDLSPGLDSSGFNRAPLYNVGDIMHPIAGDPYNDNGQAARDSYTNAGRAGFVSNKKPGGGNPD